MAINTVAGPMTIDISGVGQLQVEGDHTWNLGKLKREAKLGPNGEVHGFSEEPQMGKVEGTIVLTDVFNSMLEDFLLLKNVTVTLKLPNGGYFILEEAFQTGDGEGSTENGTIKYGFQGTGRIQE